MAVFTIIGINICSSRGGFEVRGVPLSLSYNLNALTFCQKARSGGDSYKIFLLKGEFSSGIHSKVSRCSSSLVGSAVDCFMHFISLGV